MKNENGSEQSIHGNWQQKLPTACMQGRSAALNQCYNEILLLVEKITI